MDVATVEIIHLEEHRPLRPIRRKIVSVERHVSAAAKEGRDDVQNQGVELYTSKAITSLILTILDPFRYHLKRKMLLNLV